MTGPRKETGAQAIYRKFCCHRYGAEARGIPFRLSFEDWCQLWTESGHWHERGSRKGQYVMARFGDKGAYELGNVRICLAEENRAERNTNYPLKAERSPSFGRNRWADKSPEQRAEWSAAHRERIARRSRNGKGQFIYGG